MSKETTSALVKEYNNEVKVTWRIPADVFKELRHMAIDENVPVTDLVTKALKDFLRSKAHSKK
jgi:hypothetical protein